MLPTLADTDPALLTRIGASAMHGLREYGYLTTTPTVREFSPDERRAYDRTQRRNWAGRKKVER